MPLLRPGRRTGPEGPAGRGARQDERRLREAGEGPAAGGGPTVRFGHGAIRGCWYGHEPSDANEQVLFDEAARLVVREVDAGRWQASFHPGRVPLPAGGAR